MLAMSSPEWATPERIREVKIMKPSQIFAHWKQIRADLLSTIDKFSDAELAYAPFEASWPAGRIMLHIADAENGWFRYVVARELSDWPTGYRIANYPTTEAIKVALTEVHGRTEEYLEALEPADLQRNVETPWGGSLSLQWIIWHVVEHEIHHRGELSLILGLLGREGLDV